MPKKKKAKPQPVKSTRSRTIMMDIITKVVIPIIVVIVPSLATFIGSVYRNHLAEPKLKCDISSSAQDRYYESTAYRSIKLVARPQIIVRYGNCVVVSVYLEDYYQNEHIIFTDGTGIAGKTDKDSTDALLLYIRAEVLNSLVQSHSELSIKEIDANLFVYISILGGVTYTNEQGSNDKRFCITEEDGSVLDYGTDEKVIRRRLREYQIKLPASQSDMEQDDRIKTLIQSSAEYIGVYCLDGTRKHIRIPNYFILGIILFAAYQIYCWHRKINAWAKKLFHKICDMDLLQRLAITVIALVITVPLSLYAANAVTATRDQRLTYAELDIAEQQPTDILFTPEQPKATNQPDHEEEPTVLERLHILEEFLGANISDSMLKYYEDLFSIAYQNGTEEAPTKAILPSWFHLEQEPYTSLAQETYEVIGVEEGKCSYSRRPANLYHLGRVLTEVVLTDTNLGHPTLNFEALLHIAADGVACGELFLTYADHSIGESEGNVRDAEDIALRNGKVYWALANILETEDTFVAYRDYVPCLWAAGFKCIEQGLSQTTEKDPEYAKMIYYLGNFSERMLPYIPQEGPDSLYNTIGKAALDYYEEAKELLEQNGNTYNSENNMDVNIQSGIDTLNGLGFLSTPDTP